MKRLNALNLEVTEPTLDETPKNERKACLESAKEKDKRLARERKASSGLQPELQQSLKRIQEQTAPKQQKQQAANAAENQVPAHGGAVLAYGDARPAGAGPAYGDAGPAAGGAGPAYGGAGPADGGAAMQANGG